MAASELSKTVTRMNMMWTRMARIGMGMDEDTGAGQGDDGSKEGG